MDVQEEIMQIEEEIRKTPYNKATQKHIGLLKAKLAKLREKTAKTGATGLGYGIKKSGDATIVLVGFPSAGKSTLLNQLSNAESKTGEYDFTTLNIIPGMMEYSGAKIQLIDVPGLVKGASEGRGRGKQVLSVIRIADLIVFVLDASKDCKSQLEIMREELYNAGFRLNQKKPDVVLERAGAGGIKIGFAVKKHELTEETAKEVLMQFGFLNGEVTIRDNISLDQFIDCLSANRVYVPSLVVLNKIDLNPSAEIEDCLKISALKGTNLYRLKKEIWKKLALMRIYMKKPGSKADLKEPLIVPKGSTILQVCEKIHKEFSKKFRFARVWGSSKFPGQKVGRDFVLKDRDIIELHLEEI